MWCCWLLCHAVVFKNSGFLSHIPFFDREIPRVLTLYDIDMTQGEAADAVRGLFHENAYVRDARVLDLLIEKGYMELEETLLQHKQRPHLLRLLEGYVVPTEGSNRKKLTVDSTIEEQFNRAH